MIRLAVVMTHPIQYFAPLWSYLANCSDIEPHVFFATSVGLESSFDPGFAANIQWNIPLLAGYESTFCRSIYFSNSRRPADAWPLGLSRSLRAGKFSGVLVHGYNSAASCAGILAAFRTGTPLLLRGDSHSKGRPSSIRAIARRFAFHHAIAPRTAAAIAIGAWNHEFWLENGMSPEQMELATYAVDNDRLRRTAATNPERVAAIRNSWTKSDEDVVFIFCAKLIQLKRLDLLLSAAARLNDPRAVVVVVGSGPMEQDWKELAARLSLRVIWQGFVNQQELPCYYAAADVQVLPSDFEQWGLVVNEGLACDCPCIVSDAVGAGPDLVSQPGTGSVFRSGDIEDLTNHLRTAMSKDNRAEWRSHCAEAVEKASYEAFASALRRLLQRGALHPLSAA